MRASLRVHPGSFTGAGGVVKSIDPDAPPLSFMASLVQVVWWDIVVLAAAWVSCLLTPITIGITQKLQVTIHY
jgi:hypothetical protein